MQQSKSQVQYKKLGLIYKGYAGKVYIVQTQKHIEENSENLNPNQSQPKANEIQVLKKYFRKKSETLDLNSLPEVSLLQNLDHHNLMNFNRVFVERLEYKCNLCLQMDLMAPLSELMALLSANEIQYAFSQIVNGLLHTHEKGIIHRDIKPSNIFISEQGVVKIGDFGISRKVQATMTPNTSTKNYRAPEIFFGSKNYTQAIDIWSLGCTLAELYVGKMLFPGKSEIEILGFISDIIGCPNEQNWPTCSQLPNYLEFQSNGKQNLSQHMSSTKINEEGITLLTSMLTLDPLKRPSCSQVAQTPYVVLANSVQPKLAKYAQLYTEKLRQRYKKKE